MTTPAPTVILAAAAGAAGTLLAGSAATLLRPAVRAVRVTPAAAAATAVAVGMVAAEAINRYRDLSYKAF